MKKYRKLENICVKNSNFILYNLNYKLIWYLNPITTEINTILGINLNGRIRGLFALNYGKIMQLKQEKIL